MENEAPNAIRDALREAPSPQNLQSVQKLMRSRRRIEPEAVAATLAELVRDRTAYQWPDFRRTARYWHCMPEEYVRERIVEIASKAALKRSELVKRGRKISHGCSEKFVQANIASLIGEGKIVKARTVGQSELLYASGKAQALIASSLELLKSRLLRAGVPEDQFTSFLGSRSIEASPAPDRGVKKDGAARVLEALRGLEPSPGMPVTARELRARIADLTKEEFDRAVMELAAEQRVYVTRHDHGWALPEADRRELILDGGGNLYVAVAARR